MNKQHIRLSFFRAYATMLATMMFVARVVGGSAGDGDVAVCMSGHIRSLTQPRVYHAARRDLLDRLSPSTQQQQHHHHRGGGGGGGGRRGAGGTDLFMYLELQETTAAGTAGAAGAAGGVSVRLNAGWDAGNAAAGDGDAEAPSEADVDEVLAVLRPVAVRFHRNEEDKQHDEDADEDENGRPAHGSPRTSPISSSSSSSSSSNHNTTTITTTTSTTACSYPAARTRPQLEKAHACFAMVLERECWRGHAYRWVVRTRPDLGWLHPLPPADAFDERFVFVSPAYWPMADQVRTYYL